jgi:putative transcriptional regulator
VPARSIVLLLLACACPGASNGAPARGSLLIAPPASADNDFARTVVLVLHKDEHGSIGIVLNRPVKMRLAEVFPEIREGKGLDQQAWAGGPVMLGINALLRTARPPNGADTLLPGVSLLATRDLMHAQIAAGTPPSAFRVYVGLCGWGPGQLEDEMRRGLWRVALANAAVVFDPAPDTLWTRLNAKK